MQVQYLHNLMPYHDIWFFSGEIIKGIGATHGFFPSTLLCMASCCYEDPLKTIKFSNFSCDTIIVDDFGNSKIKEDQINIYPIPAKTNL